MIRVTIGLCVMTLAGCGTRPLASVEGVVTLDGQPLADVEVQFLPDPSQGSDGPPASAYTGRDGRYQILAAAKTGVVVGRHRVCINDATLMMPGGDPEGGEPNVASATPRRSRFPTDYSDATRTPFQTIEVRPGVQTVDFALESRSAR